MAHGQYEHKGALRSHLDQKRMSLAKSVESAKEAISRCEKVVVHETEMVAQLHHEISEYEAAIALIEKTLIPAIGAE